MTMDSSLPNLIQKEVALLEELLSILRKDREAVIRGSADALEELLESNKRKETLLLKLRMLEEGRRRLSARSSREEESLGPLKEKLRGLVEEIHRQGSRNRLLLEGSIHLIRTILTNLFGSLSPNPSYNAQGEMTPQQGAARIDGRI